jgi:hypothetical protein
MRKELPVTFNVNVGVDNPNSIAASGQNGLHHLPQWQRNHQHHTEQKHQCPRQWQ